MGSTQSTWGSTGELTVTGCTFENRGRVCRSIDLGAPFAGKCRIIGNTFGNFDRPPIVVHVVAAIHRVDEKIMPNLNRLNAYMFEYVVEKNKVSEKNDNGYDPNKVYKILGR